MTPKQFQTRLTQIENDTIIAINREYRQTRLEIFGAINDLGADSPALFDQIRIILAQLNSELSGIVSVLLISLKPIMEDYARQQFDSLGLDGVSFNQFWAETESERETILNGIQDRLRDTVAVIDARFRSTLADMQGSKDDDKSIASRLVALQFVDGRASEWRHGRNLLDSETQKSMWGAAGAGIMVTFSLLANRLKQRGEKDRIVKKAIATIDSRTTQTCFRVHGQVQPIDKPFSLTGTPRYANAKMLPPFHDYCRTVIIVELSIKVD